MSAGTRPRAPLIHVRPRRPDAAGPPVELDVLAWEAGLHPDVVRHFISFGLLEPVRGGTDPPRFPRDAAARLARAARLRRDLGLNVAGAVLACDLLTRIDDLQRRLARYEPPTDPRR